MPSPFRVIRNFYGGKCFGFLPPDFLWKEGVRRIGIYLRKPSFVRYFVKKVKPCMKTVFKVDPQRTEKAY